jgi:hypothetical protein
MASLKNTTINDTGNLTLPNGTTAQRPTGSNGMMRYNTSLGQMEIYAGGDWRTVSTDYAVEFVLVAGGGGGGGGTSSGGGGGGGGGGVIYISSYIVSPGTGYSITIGGGGAGAATNGNGTAGSNSTGFGYTAIGGGYGGNIGGSGGSGGSGGGTGRDAWTSSGGSGTVGQGHNGGSNMRDSWGAAGGGGGAWEQGYDGGFDQNGRATSYPSDGGAGLPISWSGTTIYYGPGGGGCWFVGGGVGTGPAGGRGLGDGGGRGSLQDSGTITATSGTANRGAGGGGSRNGATGSGGSGRCVIRYYGPQRGSGGTVTSSGGYTIHTFDSAGTFTA